MRHLIICIILLSGIVQKALTQDFEVRGRVVSERENEPIEYANIVLLSKDSSFVAGTITDSIGSFSLNKVKRGNYIVAISSLGYRREHIYLDELSKDISLGNIVLRDEAMSLEGVTVTASSERAHADKRVIVPSKRQLNASSNGVELLQQMMLPRVYVDKFNNTIKIVGNGIVQLRINGVKVEQSEINALRSSDIIRIEYHDNPSLRYGETDVVLNYIVRRHETGGELGFNSSQGLNAMWGEHNLQGKINHKESEWKASYRIGARDFYDMTHNKMEQFNLSANNRLERQEVGDDSRLRLFMHNMNLSYSLQKDAGQMFSATLRYQRHHSPHIDYKGGLTNIANINDRIDMLYLSSSRNQTPSLDIYYQRELKHKQNLIFNIVGTYDQSRSRRIYQENRDNLPLTNINNSVKGNKYTLIGEAIYEKTVANGNKLSVGLRHCHSFSDNTYINSDVYGTRMKQTESSFYTEFKGKLNRIDYTVGFAINRLYHNLRGESSNYERYTFNPRLTLFYAPSDESSIRLKSKIVNVAPSLSELSAIDQKIDSFQVERGNPYLKSYMSYYTELNYDIRKGIFNLNALTAYEYQPNAIMEEKRLENGIIIQSWDNHKNWQRLAASSTLRIGPVKDILQFSFTGGVNHYISNGNSYNHKYTNWWCNGNISLTWKKWSLMYLIETNWNWFKGETMQGGENIQLMELGYNHKELRVKLGVFNPFTNNHKMENENWNKYASYYRLNSIKEISGLFIATISYRLSFGRKLNGGNKRTSV